MHVLVGLKRDHIGLADVLEDMCLTPVTPHGFLVFIDLLFWNGLRYPAAEMVAPHNFALP